MAYPTPIDNKTRATVLMFGKRLQMAHIPYDKLIVFGSHAKGTSKSWSDIDLCVVSKTFGKNRHTERVKLMLVRDVQTIDIEPHPYNPKDLLEKYDSLANEIRIHGISI